jgi:hypothetical protein
VLASQLPLPAAGFYFLLQFFGISPPAGPEVIAVIVLSMPLFGIKAWIARTERRLTPAALGVWPRTRGYRVIAGSISAGFFGILFAEVYTHFDWTIHGAKSLYCLAVTAGVTLFGGFVLRAHELRPAKK